MLNTNETDPVALKEQIDGMKSEEIKEEFNDVLQHIMHLYLYLDDDELSNLFTDNEGIQMASQYALAFLYLGLKESDAKATYKITSTIKQAEATNQNHAVVDLDITTEPFLPPKRRLEALEQDDLGRISLEALEDLIMSNEIEAEAVVEALPDEESADDLEDIIQGREDAEAFERLPVSVVSNAEINIEDVSTF